MTRFLVSLLAMLAVAGPALAQTRALPPGEIRANGDITFGNALKLGKRESGKTIITPDTLQILGSGSTGDASDFDVGSDILPLRRKLRSKLSDLPITPEDFPNLLTGSDKTAAVQAAIDTALAYGRPMQCDRTYSVSKILVASPGLRLRGTCYFVGNATSPTNAVFELRGGVVAIEGSLNVSANYNTNYETAILWSGNTQGSHVENLSASAAKLCFTFGSPDKPSALISEITLVGGRTYGCTQVAKVIGIQTAIYVIGAQWSSDAFGAPSQGWAGVPFRGVTGVGSDFTMIGGELVMPQSTTGALIDNQPITGANGEGTYYSRMRFKGLTLESPSQYAITSNPAGLTIAPSSQQRGFMMFDSISGFHSRDEKPLITTSADFDGDVIVKDFRVIFPNGTRTQPNVQAGGPKTDVRIDDGGFGPGFQGAIAGTAGPGNVHFSDRQIIMAYGLNGQSFPAGNTIAKFAGLDSGGDRARFSSNYNPATGVFTVPPGGLKELRIEAAMQLGGTGNVYVNRTPPGGSSASLAVMPYANGTATISFDGSDAPAGTQFSVSVLANTATTGGGPDFFNILRIRARN